MSILLHKNNLVKGGAGRITFLKIDLELGPVLYSKGCGKTVPEILDPKKNSKFVPQRNRPIRIQKIGCRGLAADMR